MPDSIALDGAAEVSREAIAACDVARIELKRIEFGGAALQRLLDRVTASGTKAELVARIAAAATSGATACRLAEWAKRLEIEFAAGAPEHLVTVLRAPAVAALCERRQTLRDDRVGAVLKVSRAMVGHLVALVETVCAAGFGRIVLEPVFITDVADIDSSVFFDRDAFNADLDRAIRTGKQRGIPVTGIKFGSQGPATADLVPGHRRLLVICLGDDGDSQRQGDSVSAFVPSLQHLELANTHFAPQVIASEAFRSRNSTLSAHQDLIDRLTPLCASRNLDPALYADVVHRLEIDLSVALNTSIQALNREIDRRFRRQKDRGDKQVLLDLSKPFLGYNWGPAISYLLPDQYQFRRSFNESQTPVILVKVKPNDAYQMRTGIHDAFPGDAIDFLQLSCNDFTPSDQAIQWEGRHCVHLCTIPRKIIEAADGYLRISYAITRKSANGNLAKIGLRFLAVDSLDAAPRTGLMSLFRSMVALAGTGVEVDHLVEGIGVRPIPEITNIARFLECGEAAAAAVRTTGFAVGGKEEIIAELGLELADLCAAGMVDEAAQQVLGAGRKIESNAVAWIKPSPVEHRYTGVDSAVQFLKLVSEVFTLRCPEGQAGSLFQKVTEIAPAWRPAWLALACCQIKAGAHDAAIHSARSAVHHDVCCIASQEVLREAYLAKYPSASEPVIDGVAVYDLTDRFCSIPFDRIETAKDGIVWTCCPAWLGAPIGNMHRTRWEDAWNSDQAAMVRQSILDGDFKYCNKGVCPVILANNLPRKSEITDQHFRHYIDNKIVKLPEGPREISLSHDPSCNLACPQCRNDFILADREQNAEFAATIDPFVKPLIEYAHLDRSVVLMSGDGEIFVSPHYRGILKLFDPEKHAGVTLNLLSNGLVFEAGWKKVPNIHKLVKCVTVSTDAASEDIYRQTRGGSWRKLYRNLEFISKLRRRGDIEQFGIHYAVQTCNFRDMRRMVEIGLELGVDRIAFAILRNGGTYDAAEYSTRTIFEPDHPEHQDFVRELRDPIFQSSIVEISQFAGFLGNA
jgi:hypothetical protein